MLGIPSESPPKVETLVSGLFGWRLFVANANLRVGGGKMIGFRNIRRWVIDTKKMSEILEAVKIRLRFDTTGEFEKALLRLLSDNVLVSVWGANGFYKQKG